MVEIQRLENEFILKYIIMKYDYKSMLKFFSILRIVIFMKYNLTEISSPQLTLRHNAPQQHKAIEK